jgi:hypothetical protein
MPSPVSYSLVKEHLLPVTGALRARVANGATCFWKSALAHQKRQKKEFAKAVFRSRRAAHAENLCVALNACLTHGNQPPIGAPAKRFDGQRHGFFLA